MKSYQAVLPHPVANTARYFLNVPFMVTEKTVDENENEGI